MTIQTFDWEIALIPDTATYQDISSDVVTTAPIKRMMGTTRAGPNARVADTGTLHFYLNNSTSNLGGLQGYYSPTHASCNANFAIGKRVWYKGDDMGTTAEYNLYYISEIKPHYGIYGPNTVEVTCEDIIGRWSKQRPYTIVAQVGQNIGQLFAEMFGKTYSSSTAAVYDYYSYIENSTAVLDYAFYDIDSTRDSIMSCVRKICESDLGYFFLNTFDNTTATGTWGERYVYEHDSRSSTAASAIFDNNASIVIHYSIRDIMNNVTYITNSLEFGTTAGEVVFTHSDDIAFQPEEGRYITVRYTDPGGGGARVNILGDLITLTGNLSSASAASSASTAYGDMNGDLTLEAVSYADNAIIHAVNNSTSVAGWLKDISATARIIRLYDPLEFTASDTASIAMYGTYDARFNMPYSNSTTAAEYFSDLICGWYGTPFLVVDSVEWIANSGTAAMDNARLQVGYVVKVIDSITGVEQNGTINGRELTIEPGNILRVKLYLDWPYAPP